MPDPESTLKPLPPQLLRRPLEREPLTHVCEAHACSPRVFALTPKEMEVLGLLNRGMTCKIIARTLNVGFETVKWHRKNLYSKLSASTRYDALENARLLGLIGG